jgi:hypothetical protein
MGQQGFPRWAVKGPSAILRKLGASMAYDDQRMIMFIVVMGLLFVLASAAFGAWIFTAVLP